MSTTQDRNDKVATHFDGCWESPKHHACAVAEIHRLRALAAHYRAEGMREAAAIASARGNAHYAAGCYESAGACYAVENAILAAIGDGK